MLHLRIIHWLRTTAALGGFIALVGLFGVLVWANQTGLPDSWRTELEQALAARGVHAEVGKLRLHPIRGVEARDVVLYHDEAHHLQIARFHRVALNIDRSRLARGSLRIDRVELDGADIALRPDPADPAAPTLEISDAYGRIDMRAGRRLEIRDGTGLIGGVRIELDALFTLAAPSIVHDPEGVDESLAFRRRVLRNVAEAVRGWDVSSETPPVARIRVEGALSDPASLRAQIRLSGGLFQCRELAIDSLAAQAELRGGLLVLHQLQVGTAGGRLSAQGDFDLPHSSATFRAESGLDPRTLFKQLRLPPPEWLPDVGGTPQISVQGRARRAADSGWSFHLTGRTSLDRPRLGHLAADSLETAFSWDGTRLLLDDLRLRLGEHRLDGAVFIAPPMVRYRARTDLPVTFWQQALKIQPLASILADFAVGPQGGTRVDFSGHANLEQPLDWGFTGFAEAEGLSFRKVPTKRARVRMDLSSGSLDFTDGEVEFDYADYALRHRHDGPASGRLEVARIKWDASAERVIIRDMRGEAWAAPVVRTFAPEVADHLETYGFHRPPQMTAEGHIGLWSEAGKHDLTVGFSSGDEADYVLLGTPLILGRPAGRVRLLDDRVEINDLTFNLWGGGFRGDLEYGTGKSVVSGSLDWTDVLLAELAATCGIQPVPRGRVTGRIDFLQRGSGPGGLSGNGHLAIEDGELFNVPMFGPLTPVVAGVLGNRAAFQEARDAFFSFGIRDGVLATQDFVTTTPSLVFTGDGTADLAEQQMEMTVRLNARGLLGVITLPLRPFYGLFQFRGKGSFRNPEWDNVMFTSPPDDQQRALLEAPRARSVPETPPSGGAAPSTARQ